VAWRLVWIPPAHREKRTAAGDRWLLQGYVLDPGAGAAPGWRRVGPALLCRGACPPSEGTVPSRASLLEALDGELLPGARLPDASLRWAAAPDPTLLASESRAALQRFLLLVGGLLAVTALGFVVLLRGVRRELALARRKEDFVAAVSHELKTPLTGIRMYAEMLREGWAIDAAAAERQAQRILDESDRLAALVNQVLDLAALERGVLRANVVRGDLAAAVRAAAESLQPRARDAGVALAVAVPEGFPPAPLDERLVRPLVLNLVDNAIKHGGRGEPRRAEVLLALEGGRAVLRVADRGPGLPPEVLEHLFEPFRRGEGELTRTTTGVGIGLALVKRYADALGAEVSVRSAPGEGTSFTVRFPG
jgi:signal transduction histidine kinase